MTARPTGCLAALVDLLDAAGVHTVFGLPGDDLTVLRELAGSRVRMVVARDQRNAVHMATGFAQMSGTVGVCVVGKGPAVAGCVGGLLEAATSRTPILLVATGTDPARRAAGAFQDADQPALVAAVVKRSFRVDHPARVAAVLQQAWALATSGVPGPVYVEFGEQLLDEPAPRPTVWRTTVERSAAYVVPDGSSALALLAAARRPVVLVGGGARRAQAGPAAVALAEQLGAVVLCTASGRGAVDEDHPLFLGLSGLYCREPVRRLLADADLIVGLGSRFEETAVMGWLEPPTDLRSGPPVIQVNIDAGEIAQDLCGPVVEGDAAAVATAWTATLRAGGHLSTPDAEWIQRIAQARTTIRHEAAATVWEQCGQERLSLAELLWTLRRSTEPGAVLVQENGLQDMWSYVFPYWDCGAAGSVVAPSEQTTLGFGAAAAIGVAVAVAPRPVIALVGDGAFTIASADLATAVDQGIGLLYVVLCNGGYGWLQAELDAREPADADRHRFADPGRPLPVVAVAGVDTVVLRGKQTLAADVAAALAAARAGRVVVALVPVRLDDRPPGIEALLGLTTDPDPSVGTWIGPSDGLRGADAPGASYELSRE